MSGDDLITALGARPDNRRDHHAVGLHAVHRVLHRLILPDAVGMVGEGMQLEKRDADDLLRCLGGTVLNEWFFFAPTLRRGGFI